MMARQLKLSGRVELQVTIGTSGLVESVRPLAGNPLLVECGVAAVKRWKFTPFMQDGVPASAVTTLSFEFKQ